MVLVSTTFLALLFTCLLPSFPGSVLGSSPAPATMLTVGNTAKPGCQSKCGNMTITYPFGIGKGCAMRDEFLITCYEENKAFTPHFWDSFIPVVGISETQLLLQANGPVAESCNSSNMRNSWRDIDLSGSPYALSSTGNKFVVIGCHHYGMMEARTSVGRQVISCVALCTKNEDLHNDACAGIGCCKVSLPKGIQRFNASMELITYNTSISSATSGDCSYAFIMERSSQPSVEFRGVADLSDPGTVDRFSNIPFVMDWFVANDSCEQARRNLKEYACQGNTVCVDVTNELNVAGYRCECRHGYEGNPYLNPGCTDIDECTSLPCAGHGVCVNIQGGYRCRDSSLRKFFILGLSVGLGCILFLLGGYWMYRTSKKREEIKQRAKNFNRNGGLLLQQKMYEGHTTGKTRLFTAKDLEKATDRFNEDRIVGRGGQAIVYKGMLKDGDLVAVKKHKIGSHSEVGDFINEIAILSEINHRNIVKLIGCCLETDVPLLVYEYVPNGTLSKYLHDPLEEFPVTWEMRLLIALDIAGALTYLHSSSSMPILHKDIKTTNILLDAKYRAKLSDFGISRSIALDQTHLSTCVQGTFGYLDPEYFQSSQYTDKSDVYSFGVVLIELLTGKKVVVQIDSDNGRSLVSWFLSCMENSNLKDILAERVVNEAREETILAIANLAKQSLKMDRKQRPTMRQVLLELEAISHHQGATISFLKSSSTTADQTLMRGTTHGDLHDADVTCSPDDSESDFNIHDQEC